MDRDEIIGKLREKVCEVVFTKASGEERKMLCTLHEWWIPAKPAFKDPAVTEMYDDIVYRQRKHQKSINVVVAWDIEKSEWRSFRVDSIKSFTETEV